MKIVLSSRNKKKIGELRTILGEIGGVFSNVEILSLDDIGYVDDTVETGTTFEENALIKAAVPAYYGYIGVADDSGLEVDALDGAPGVFSARYAGEPCDDEKNNQKLLAALDGMSYEKRTAHYVCAMACVFPDGRQFALRGTCPGHILTEYHGDGGFGYDPLFYSDVCKKTFAEVSPEEKNGVSHRGYALRAFAKKFAEYVLPTPVLTGKQRAYLRSLSSQMPAAFQIGKSGVSEEICHQIDNALKAKELAKFSVLETCAYGAREAAEATAFATGSAVVSVIGRKFVLFRQNEKQKDRRIVLP